MTELEGADGADVGFEYGESGGGLSNSVDAGTSLGVFDATVDDLEPDTEYEFRAVAETDEASDEGDVLTFTTEEEEEDDDDDDENTAPVIDSWDMSTRASGPWFRATSTWDVSDDNGNLDTVTTELLDGGSVVDSESTNVSGSSASGEHEPRTRGDADEVRLVVTDEEGETTTDTETV